MSAFGVSENEWRKVSSSADEVGRIRNKYERLLAALKDIAITASPYISDLTVDIDVEAGSALIKSFAGVSSVRLAWRVEKDSLEGVMAVYAARSDGAGFHPILDVFIPSSGGAYLPLESGDAERSGPINVGNFAYTVLMNVVRKQVDLSAQL